MKQLKIQYSNDFFHNYLRNKKNPLVMLTCHTALSISNVNRSAPNNYLWH